MTTAHSSTTFQRALRQGPTQATSCLRLRWAVAPAALGRPGRKPVTLELELPSTGIARLIINDQPSELARAWRSSQPASLTVHRVAVAPGVRLVIADASPLAVAVLDPSNPDRPAHVACDLPKVLGLKGGQYELVGGGLS